MLLSMTRRRAGGATDLPYREDRGMVSDQGCYEERYRLTYPVARGLACSFLPLIVAIFSHQTLPWVILSPAVLVLATVPWLVAVASRKVAFRADMTGITLGADPLSWPFRHASAVFVPWSDAAGIALYSAGGPFGNMPASRCPVPGVAAGAVRPITTWRLDRDRLAALTAAVAPGIPVIDAVTGANQSVEGAGQASTVIRMPD
jgi:hypothetical protein